MAISNSSTRTPNSSENFETIAPIASPLSWRERVSAYRELSKSGIVTLVLISVLGGYLAGQPLERSFEPMRLALTLFGILFLASGSSALNQYQDRAMDARMPRTANRPIPAGKISGIEALAFSSFTILSGLVILSWIDPALCALGLLAILSYNVLYTLWWKRSWSFGAVPGALPGALPILMGYAASQREVLTRGGVYLFFILFFWQMPHFWALALRYREDYEKGGIPTLSVTHGTGITVAHIVLWCLAYVALALVAPVFLPVGAVYCISTFPMHVKVLLELRKFVKEPESNRWLHFFLWINFSLIIYLAAAVIDLWSVYLVPYLTR